MEDPQDTAEKAKNTPTDESDNAFYSGSNLVYCNGRIIMGPERKYFFLTVVLMVGVFAVFLAFPARFLYHILSEAIPFVGSYIFLQAFALLLITAFTDPGIIPRALPPEQEDPFAPLFQNITIDNIPVKLKWCNTCNFFRPPRASHCSTCNNCVENFDHHCPWIANCIGRRNYRYFFGFVVFIFLLCAYVFAFSLYHVVEGFRDSDKNGTPIPSIVTSSISFISLAPVTSLLYFHLVIMARSETTNENLMQKYFSTGNPFDKGLIHNVTTTLCGVRYPRLIKPMKRNLEMVDVAALGGLSSIENQYEATPNETRTTTPLESNELVTGKI